MSTWSLSCWNKNCLQQFSVIYKDVDQALFCPTCSEVATFLNLGYVVCQSCSFKNKLPLPNGLTKKELIKCGHCHKSINSNQPIRIYNYEQLVKDMGADATLGYCGRHCFTGREQEVEIARKAIERISSRGKLLGIFGKSSAASPKKVMFVRRMGPSNLPGVQLPIKFIQAFHAYCNFKIEFSHENAKFSGTLGQYGNSEWIFKRLIGNGLLEIWFDSSITKNEFESLPTLDNYFNLFRV